MGRSSDVEVSRKFLGEVGPSQREVHHRFQEPELVPRVVADALHFAGIDRARLEQLAQAVRELDFPRTVALRGRQRREDIRRQDVAADDGEIGRRFLTRGFSTRSRT